MTFDERTARLWMAMDIGPLWIGRDEQDPLSPEAIMRDEPKVAVPEVAEGQTKVVSRPQEVSVSPVAKPVAKPTVAPIAPVTFNPAKPQDLTAIATADWIGLEGIVSQCQSCPTLAQSRLSTVFGVRAPVAKIVIVGEAPGRDEDIQGKPFVGKSGELLDNILAALGLEREKDVAIINVLKCRPPNNRNPQPEEISACRAYLERQLAILQPQVVILAGKIAAHTLLHTEASMSALRKTEHCLTIAGREVPTVVTYHPSYLLRSPTDKLAAWRDFNQTKRLLTAQ